MDGVGEVLVGFAMGVLALTDGSVKSWVVGSFDGGTTPWLLVVLVAAGDSTTGDGLLCLQPIADRWRLESLG